MKVKKSQVSNAQRASASLHNFFLEEILNIRHMKVESCARRNKQEEPWLASALYLPLRSRDSELMLTPTATNVSSMA
jgi:hypothetical protein